MNRIFIVVLILIGWQKGFTQETTIYNSPHDFKTSSIRLKEAIIASGFKVDKIKTRQVNLNVDNEPLNIIYFEFEDEVITNSIVTCEPTALLDMPFKMVIWEEEDEVFIGYVDTMWLRRRFLIKGCDATLSEYSKILIRIANQTIKSE